MRFAAAFGTAVLFSASKLASGFALSKLWGRVRERRLPAHPRGVRALHWVALLALPVAVNYHAPAWNSLLE